MQARKLKWPLGLAGVLLLLAAPCPPRADAQPGAFLPDAAALVRPEGFPSLCKWMLGQDFDPAHWLGARVGGKELLEPLNVLILDSRSRTAQEARERLEAALAAAGFPGRFGHSSGYHAFVDGKLLPQLPAGSHRAYADEPFELPNDHGRVFGPIPAGGRYLFVAGFSRESIAPLYRVKHRYVSFNRARERLARSLDQRSEFKRHGFVDLENSLPANASHSTGDHDGRAVLLER